MMAVWTPGSYLIREYERHVENVAATGADGALLTVSKTAKNRWALETGGAATVVPTAGVATSALACWIWSADVRPFALPSTRSASVMRRSGNALPCFRRLRRPSSNRRESVRRRAPGRAGASR